MTLDPARHRMEALVGLAWAEIETRHPAQAAAFEATCKPIEAIIECLPNDERYDELVKQTEAETDIGNVVKAVVPVITDIALKLIAGA